MKIPKTVATTIKIALKIIEFDSDVFTPRKTNAIEKFKIVATVIQPK